MNSSATALDWDERTSAHERSLEHADIVFESFFDRSFDAVWLFDPQTRVFVDCNQAAVELIGAKSKAQILQARPEDISPSIQPNGSSTRERTAQIIALVEKFQGQRFEWVIRHMSGHDIPLEVSATPTVMAGRNIYIVISRDISERKKAERESRELNLSLERRVAERTAELSASEARFRALVEHASEAIVVYSVDTGRFLFGNQHACNLYGVSMAQLPELSPADVSPEFQPCGRRTSDLVGERMSEVLSGGISVFEWVHRRSDGSTFPTEVRLLRLPAEGQTLIRASIIDNTERKRAERALRESEAKFRALFEGASQGVVLHDENQIVEANPAAVRIIGRRAAHEIIGRHPGDFAPPFQPNGESSDVAARRYINECLIKGSTRFEWTASDPKGREIPLEVGLTRIEWSGRQIIQAFITDISERKKAEAELQASEARLRESEARFSAAFRASPVFMTIARMDNGHYVLANEAFLKLTGYPLEEVLGYNSMELALWCDPAERELFWAELRRTGSIHERECRARNRQGRVFTLLVSSDVIVINGVPHLLSVGLDITERKQAEAELRVGEARLRESEARFSAAFHASPIITGITSARDGKFVLVNDASLAWSGYRRDEVIGRTALELGVWVNAQERDDFWDAVRNSGGSIRQRECRLRNRHGKISTMLGSGAVIVLNGEEHLLFMMIDISERKKTEAELHASETRLRESEARFSAAFHASPALIGILRMSDGRYVLANDAHLNWLGYASEEVIGRTCVELGMWENPAERDVLLADMKSSGSIRQRECRWRNRRGDRFTVLLSAETIKLNDAPHMLSIVLDITQRKRAEEEIVRALEREKELSQLKSNFVSMVSHEFRTPLGIIHSSAELLRDFHGRMASIERDEQLESVIRNTRRMAGMMEEILALSRLDAGKLIFQPNALDLNFFFRRVVDEVLSATNRRCPVELTISSMPPSTEADERLLGHIFTNLLSNAVKYSEAGAAVHFTVERDGQDAVCVVRDSGIGIAEEDQQQLFKAFHRGGNVGTRPGTGLGLLLVKRCAELHGGNVHVNSRIGEGTTVIVTLPFFRS